MDTIDNLMEVNNGSLSDKEKTKAIRQEVTSAGKDLRKKYPFLDDHQDAIGLGIHIFSTIMIVLSWILFFKLSLSPWIVIPWCAFWMSILHELEHDTIHYMYFKKHKWVQDYMLGMGWVLRPLTINPWFRRHLHFNHHRVSGTKTDIEERSVTNGENWGILRLIKTPDLLLGGLLRLLRVKNDIRDLYRSGQMSLEDVKQLKFFNAFGFLPFGLFLHFIWYFFVIHYTVHGISNLFSLGYESPAWLEHQLRWVNPLVVILIAPNMLRQFCIHFITSNMHYYGDIESGNIMQQTQVLNKWYFIPFQLFCFNFGSTHAIHHFVVNETFYIRQLTAGRSHAIMKKMGVRFNDLGTFKRANRFNESSKETAVVV